MASMVIPSLLVATLLIQCAACLAFRPVVNFRPVTTHLVRPPAPANPPVHKHRPELSSSPSLYCPQLDTSKCVNLLSLLTNPHLVGRQTFDSGCCTLIHGLKSHQVATSCLCAIAKEVNGDTAYNLNSLARHCGYVVPDGYRC